MRVLVSVAVLASIAAASLSAAGSADAARITVVKAKQSAVVDTARRSGRLEVVRGKVPREKETATTDELGPLAARPWRTIGGRGLWFYNAGANSLIGCRLVGTGRVGVNKRIKCSPARHAPAFD